jgi:hypothetical protein
VFCEMVFDSALGCVTLKQLQVDQAPLLLKGGHVKDIRDGMFDTRYGKPIKVLVYGEGVFSVNTQKRNKYKIYSS